MIFYNNKFHLEQFQTWLLKQPALCTTIRNLLICVNHYSVSVSLAFSISGYKGLHGIESAGSIENYSWLNYSSLHLDSDSLALKSNYVNAVSLFQRLVDTVILQQLQIVPSSTKPIFPLIFASVVYSSLSDSCRYSIVAAFRIMVKNHHVCVTSHFVKCCCANLFHFHSPSPLLSSSLETRAVFEVDEMPVYTYFT